jgi:hypothetical protein
MEKYYPKKDATNASTKESRVEQKRPRIERGDSSGIGSSHVNS